MHLIHYQTLGKIVYVGEEKSFMQNLDDGHTRCAELNVEVSHEKSIKKKSGTMIKTCTE